MSPSILPHAPTSRRLALCFPPLVVVATGALLAWSLWPVLQPVRRVEVTQAVFERSSVTDTSRSTTSTDRPSTPTVQAPGWLEAEPFYIGCSALIDGVVEEMLVLEGDAVERGQVVARLVDEDAQLGVRRAEAALAVAEASLASAVAESEAAQRAFDEPVELERAIASGRAALEEARAELAQLPSLIEAGEATLVRLEEELARTRASVDTGAINDIELVVATQRVAVQRAELAALRAREAILDARVDRLRADLTAARRDLELRIEDTRRLESARAGVALARARLEDARVRRDEAALELERTVIRAPIDGYVQTRLKAPGDKVVRMMDDPSSAHLVHLYDPDRLQVRVDVPLADAAHVSVGQACEVVVEVLPDRVFAGVVLRSTHEADLQKNTLQFKVRVIDPDPVLRPEMLTRVKFLGDDTPGPATSGVEQPEQQLLIEARAIDTTGDRPRVWRVGNRSSDRGELRSVPIETIETRGEFVLVRAPLLPGDLLAIDVPGAVEGEQVIVQRSEGVRS